MLFVEIPTMTCVMKLNVGIDETSNAKSKIILWKYTFGTYESI